MLKEYFYLKKKSYFFQSANNPHCFAKHSLIALHLVCIALVFITAPALSAEAQEKSFKEGKFEKGELRYINDVPVLIVVGSPEEIGRQKAALTGDVVNKLVDYPKQFMQIANKSEERWQKLINMANALRPNIPEDYRTEMRTFATNAGFDKQWDIGFLTNVMIDIYRGGFSCSSIMAEASRSATGGPIFGHNLDFYTLGMLDKYGLVTVHRPNGKHAFACIGFPGFFGCVQGMNDAGLAIAVHEIFLSKDGAPMYNPKGMPYSLCFRRILEECTTVEEAEKLLRSTERTTLLSLSVCDRRKAVVLEMTPKTVARRGANDGLCFCTNHFRTPELSQFAWCGRYLTFEKSRSQKTLSVSDIAKKLDEVNMGRLTVESMIFETQPLILHVAMGSCPSSALPMKKVELQPLFK